MVKSIMHEQLCQLGGSPVIARETNYDKFTFPLHHHSEYEIMYIKESTGLRFVADKVEPFGPGDLNLFGSNLPHYMKSNEDYSLPFPVRVRAVIIQFPEDFLDHAINHYPEFQQIKTLLDLSQRGIHFPMPENEHLIPLVTIMPKLEKMERIIGLIRLLEAMSQATTFYLQKSAHLKNTDFLRNDNRLEKALHYLQEHYKRPISLKDVADKIGMNETSFSRFFKEKTSKTFTRYLQEIRVGHACHLLQKTELYITQIAAESGFNDVFYFNRCFKQVTQMSPSKYRKLFVEK